MASLNVADWPLTSFVAMQHMVAVQGNATMDLDEHELIEPNAKRRKLFLGLRELDPIPF